MAVQDSRIFRLLFEPRGAIDQFKERPDRNFVVIRGYFIAKKPILRLIRYLLPGYRVYKEDNQLVEKLYLGKTSDINIRRLSNSLTPPILSDEQVKEFEKTTQNQQDNPEQKEEGLNKWLDRLEGKKEEIKPAGGNRPQIPQETPPKINLPRPEFKIPSTLKDFSSQGQILVRQGGINAVRGIGGMFKGVGGNLLGGGARLGTGALQFGGRGLVAAGAAVGGSAGAPFIIAFIVVLGVLILGPILINLLQSESLLPPFQQNVSTAEAAGTTDINSCQFYRGGDPTPAQSYKSSLLLQYFQQAEQLTSVPATLLAAVARIESPSIIGKTDADIPALGAEKCPISDTIALGIMQVEPPWGTAGYFPDGVAKGASFLNKTTDQLTQADFCDPQSNIILSAGFILKKLQLGYKIGDGNKWDPKWTTDQAVINKIAESYYGCLEYGTSEKTATGTTKCAGPYNYGTDLWNSLQSCQVSPTIALSSCPVPEGVIKNPSYQASPMGGHCSVGYGSCPAESRRAKSIDIDTQGQEVIFPTINGQKVNWSYVIDFPLNKPGDCEGGVSNCGSGYVFQAQVEPDVWILHLLHLNPNQLFFRINNSNESGTAVGKTVPGIFLHINIGRNIKSPANPPVGNTDLDPGWIAPDIGLKMCVQ